MRVVYLLLLILISNICFSQSVGIGTTSPNASAQLEVSSTSKGMLLPRMTFAQRNAITNPAQGLMIFCTNCGANGEWQGFDGVNWMSLTNNLAAAPLPTITTFTPTTAASGATVTITGTNFLGVDYVDFGGIPATSFTVVNATTITAVVGAGASGAVSVNTLGGTAVKTGFTFSSTTPTPTANNIYAKVSADASLSTFKGLIDKGGVKSILENPEKNFTIFAPVNAVLNAYGLTATSPGIDQATSGLLVAYHTIDGKYTTAELAKDVPAGQNQKYLTIATPNNPQDSVFVTKFNNTIYVNGIDIDAANKDIPADNGVIHKLNSQYGVLFPPANNALDYINRPSTSASGLDSLAKAIKRAGVAFPGGLTAFENVLKNTVVTFIAPTNKAFQDFFAAQPTFKKIDDFTPSALLSLLSDHLIIGRYFTPNILYATSPLGGSTGVKNYGNVPVKFASPFSLYLNPQNAASIAVPDIMVFNGTIHKVNQIMFR